MTSAVRIGGAFIVGMVLIFGALQVQEIDKRKSFSSVVVAKAPIRTYIESSDSDGDGIKDWEENMEARAFEQISVPLPIDESSSTGVQYVSPTTFTGKFSEALFKDYLDKKIRGEDMSDSSELVGTAVTAIEQYAQSIRHTHRELTLIPTSPESIREYGNEVATYMQRNSVDAENEATILSEAYEKNDPKILAQLDPIYASYETILFDTLHMPVPTELAETHLLLLNAFEAIRTDVDAMRDGFLDPLYTLARMRIYTDDTKALLYAFQEILRALNTAGVRYSDDEPGSLFYIFEL